MQRSNRLSANAAFFAISALFALLLFSFSNAGAVPRTTAGITKLDSNLLQFKAGNHILGFAPNKAYLASMDHALSVQFLGTRGVTPTADTNTPATGALIKAPSLSKVVYKDLWDGISLTYIATKDGITESTYHVAPGADISQISLRYNVPVEMQKDGSLTFTFDTGALTESAPIAWQEINGKRQAVNIAFKMNDGIIGFQVGNYDRTQPLIIDPTYQWHTFYGSTGYHTAQGIVIDGSGNVYVTGYSANSWNGPADQAPLNAFSVGGNVNIFVLKLNSNGAYQWHTFYGSGRGEVAYGIAIDGNGDVYVTGESPSAWNGPAPENTAPLHAWSSAPGCSNLFVLKLNSSGAYQWHTFYGSPPNGENCTGNIMVKGIAIDGSGYIYVTGDEAGAGWTGPSGQAPVNPFNNSYTYNPFILKLNSSGAYEWHTFYGYHDNGGDTANAIAIDGSSSIYVTGTSSTAWNGPGVCSTPGISPCPLNDFSGTTDIFILKLNSSGAYQWHTFFGSGAWNGNKAFGLAIDGSSSVYVTGWSEANWNGPGVCSTPGISPCPLNDFNGYSDIFVLKLNSSGVYQWHTFYGADGSNGNIGGRGITIDARGYVYVTGMSWATWNGPNTTPPLNSVGDLVIIKLSSSGAYQWHTFYGPGGDYVYGMAMHGNGDIYVTGLSESTWNGPTGQPPLHTYDVGSNYNFFVLKLNDPSASSLYADFADTGLNQWNGTTWTQLTNSHPASMVASGTSLYIDFAGDGFYKWNGSGFSLLTKDHPASMVASGTSLYAGFAGYGLYQWNGSTWITLTNSNPASMVASGTSLYAGFAGYGLYQWNGSTWTTLTNSNPASMVASGTSLYAGFAGYGLYQWNGSTWITLTNSNPASMVASGTSLYADFAAYGLFEWNGSTWITLTNSHPASMVASDTSLYVDFAGDGLYQWSGSTWTKLTNSHPTGSMVASGTSLYVDFAGDGLYEWNGSTWTKLINNHPARMVAGF